jgi:hypothetical protein
MKIGLLESDVDKLVNQVKSDGVRNRLKEVTQEAIDLGVSSDRQMILS